MGSDIIQRFPDCRPVSDNIVTVGGVGTSNPSESIFCVVDFPSVWNQQVIEDLIYHLRQTYYQANQPSLGRVFEIKATVKGKFEIREDRHLERARKNFIKTNNNTFKNNNIIRTRISSNIGKKDGINISTEKRKNDVDNEKNENEESNRKLFNQIVPPLTTIREIEAMGLGKPHKIKTSRYATKVAIKEKIKLKERIKEVYHEPEEELEVRAKCATSFPDEDLPELAFVGRSNVGKSSLINALADTTIVRTSDKPGLTQQINFFAAGRIETYISTRKTLKRLYVLLDARHGIKIADIEFLKMLDEKNVTFQIILTKCDLVIPPDLARRHFLVQETLRNNYTNSIDPPLMVSSVRKKSGIIKLRKELLLVIGALDKAREVMRRKNTSLKLNKAKDKNNNNNYNNSFVKSNNAKKFNRRTKKTR
ncbi:9201_t:CDS:2 [Entrophospora sp. SA101]|nr:9201_t:CDS:2 [Entrophospora sp. SA101]